MGDRATLPGPFQTVNQIVGNSTFLWRSGRSSRRRSSDHDKWT